MRIHTVDGSTVMEDPVLKIERQQNGAFTLLRCSGRIVEGDGADALRRAVLSQDKSSIVIDLGDVSAIDAAGLGTLAGLQQWAHGSGRTLQLANVPHRIRELLESTKLISVLEVYPGAQAASEAA